MQPTVTFAVTQDWGSGFQAEIAIANPAGGARIDGWQLAFDYAPHIAEIWNATVVNRVGTRYTIGDAGWNAPLAPGATVRLGFNGDPGGPNAPPTDYALNGVPLNGGGGPPALPSLSIGDVSVTSPPTNATVAAAFPVTLSAPSAGPVTVSFATADITARAGTDYMAGSGVLTFAPGQTSAAVAVVVNHVSFSPASGPSAVAFSVTLSAPTGATLGRATGVATVSAPPAVAAGVSFRVITDWGSGFTGQITLTNSDAARSLDNWTLGFDYGGQIAAIWSASIYAHVGARYTIRPESWNASVPPGGSVTFGFTGNPGGVTAQTAPSNYAVLAGGGSGALPPSAGDVAVSVMQGGSAVVPVLDAATDPSGYPLTLASVGPAQHGTAVADRAAGTATYTPAAGYAGPDSFTYTVSDGRGNTATGTVSVTVTPVPPPVAGNASVSTAVDTPVVVAVLSYADDPAGLPLSLASVGAAQHGTVARNADGTATYTPSAGYSGWDSFAYTVSDGRGGTATGTVAVAIGHPAPPSGNWPASVFAPYIDATDWPIYDFLGVAKAQGLRFFNLAFVVSGPNNEPSWGAYQAYDVAGTSYSATMRSNIQGLRAIGGDVAVSFGGALNRELANVFPTVTALQDAYQSVIDAYDLTRVDFDIEGADVGNTTTVNLRSRAMAGLQAAAAAKGKNLDITITLPVLPSGLTSQGLGVVASAIEHGVRIRALQVMTMDFYAAAPNPQGRMGAYSIQATQSTFAQLKGLYGSNKTDAELWAMIGIVPMIGINDDPAEVFEPADAQQVETWAKQQGVGVLSFWSLNRDRTGPPSYNCTGTNTYDFEYSTIFKSFNSV